MKKLSIYTYVTLCAIMTNAITIKAGDVMSSRNEIKKTSVPFLRQFETAKSDALMTTDSKTEEAKSDLDKIIDTLENALGQVRTLKAAVIVAHQHQAVSHKVEEVLQKNVDGKTKGKIAAYRATADIGVSKANASINGIKHLANKTNERAIDAVKNLKEATANDVKNHNQAQNALASADANPTEPSKHSKAHKKETTKDKTINKSK